MASGKGHRRGSNRGGKGGGNRAESGYWMFGTHACLAALENPMRKINRVVATRAMAEQIDYPHIDIKEHSAIDGIVPPGSVHQGIAVLTKPLDQPDLEEVAESQGTLMMLDQVTDPHNVGAILRSAAAFGVKAVIYPKDNAPNESGTLAKSACGALEMVPLIQVTNLSNSIKTVKKMGYWIAGLDGEAREPIEKAKGLSPLCLVMGAEGKGLRRLTQEHCDTMFAIPMDPQMESLNVSNAAAIALYASYHPHNDKS
ncbi:MAG: 23S rRNA (guanosine(2251)-2'-O)-methyltransferase RlmB [Rickettsiales bacterium]|nr:23S rRNA (guanosine(2251)-2'-O)-methyltransferase RlmB [Rickettsiales bacterium]